jgi:antitoxin MazE
LSIQPGRRRREVKVKVQRWGHSLAVRIPKSYAADTRIQQDTEVELSIDNGRLIISPLLPRAITLEELLENVTPENLHREFETGPPVRSEIW